MNAGATSSPPGNRTLSSAKAAKQDEFYTQLPDIANELKHYRDHFRGKVVLCNCEDTYSRPVGRGKQLKHGRRIPWLRFVEPVLAVILFRIACNAKTW
jgi:hypothetical protein